MRRGQFHGRKQIDGSKLLPVFPFGDSLFAVQAALPQRGGTLVGSSNARECLVGTALEGTCPSAFSIQLPFNSQANTMPRASP